MRCHASFGSLSFWDCFYSDIRRAYAFVLYGRKEGRLVVLPRRNFGRIYAELWCSGLIWTKNSAYRTVPFLDFWVLDCPEWYWNYNQLFWKLMKGIGCWINGCIPSECFEVTHKLFKLTRWNNLNIWICRFFLVILNGERSEPENFCWKSTFYAKISLIRVHTE